MICVGTSGWNYSHWKKVFYPESSSKMDWLKYYSEIFKSVEINNSFYHLPDRKTFMAWHDRTPDDFLFSVKASRYITHMKKLKDPESSTEKLLTRVRDLKNKLGPVLFQLPPRWNCNTERIKGLLEVLPGDLRYTFEFRDPSWWCDEVYRLLGKFNAAFCIYELAGTLSPEKVTADFVYIRLHGPGSAYEGKYNKKTLSGWAGALSQWERQGLDAYCYFDNDHKGYACENAESLAEMLNPG